MNIKDAPITEANVLDLVKADLKAADVLKTEQDNLIAKWKSEYNGELYGNEGGKNSNKAKIVSRDIKRQSEWQHASIIDPFVALENVVKCNPVTYEDTAFARQNEIVLNTQFSRKFDRYNFVSKATKVLDQEGTVVIQTGWDYKDKVVEKTARRLVPDGNGGTIIVEDKVEETVVIKNQPTARVCRNSDIWIDPTAQDNLDDVQFIIHRYETDLSTLRQDPRYKNLNKVLAKVTDSPIYEDQPDKTFFQFEDEARKKRVVHEYWGNLDISGDGITVPIVCAWTEDVIIRFDKSPYPDGKPPFLVVPFNSVPFKMHGEANAEMIGDNQKVKTAIYRGLLDNMAQSNNGQVGVRKNALDPGNRKRFLDGKSFEFNGDPGDFWQGSYNQIPSSVFDILSIQNNEIESLTGVKSFSGGINGNSLGTTATGARGAMDAASVRRLNIVRNIGENLIKPLMRKWMSYNAEFLDEEEIVRITNEQFVPVHQDDLAGKIDISIEIATAEDNAAKSQELSFLLQTLGPNEDPAIRRDIMAEIMTLMRMPEAAKRMREYEPQPDPAMERLQELEIKKLEAEIALRHAEIADLQSKSKENDADYLLKLAKAEVEKARVRDINSKADLTDLDFIIKDEGFAHLEKAELEQIKQKYLVDLKKIEAVAKARNEEIKQQYSILLERIKHENNMQQMQYQKRAGDHNIGVIQ